MKLRPSRLSSETE